VARLAETTRRRRRNAARLTEGLTGVPGLVTPLTAPGREHVYHQYVVRITDDAPLDRDAVVAQLASRGVQAAVYYPRVVFDYPVYRDHPNVVVSDVPVARHAARQVLALPVHPNLSDADLDRVVDAVRASLGA
jgi:dTDP-4-amino-4,6-dideoxygalactose transaminase